MPKDQTFLEFLNSLGGPKEFHPGVIVDPIYGKAVEIYLEDVSYYAEWIKGEGGDIAIYRANDDDRVVGAYLPLRVWKGQFPVSILGPEG